MIQNNNTDIIKAAYGNLYSTFMRRDRKAIEYYCYFDADEDTEPVVLNCLPSRKNLA